MKRILLTGMSGTGKSSVIRELAARGYKAIDLDEGWSERGSEGDWVWREDALQRLLDDETNDILFISGCATNQGKFYPQFDYVILLSAPAEVIMERIQTRTNNSYGKHPDELAQVLNDLQTVEPLLRKSAHDEINTDLPLEEVVEKVLRIARQEE